MNRTWIVPMIIAAGIVLSFQPLQAQDQIWSVNYGGAYNEDAYAGAVASGGGYAVLGNVFLNGNGGYNFYLLRLNSVGDTVWSRNYGGDSTDYGYDIKRLSDGGYIMVGSTRSFGNGNKDLYAVRTDSLGGVVWTRTVGGTGDDNARGVTLAPDGGFVICGTTDSYGAGYTDMYIVKLDASGNVSWTKTFGGTAGDVGAGIIMTPDNGFLAIGSTGSFGSGYSSIYVVRINSAGDSLWARTYGGTRADFGHGLTNAVDGGYVLVGRTASFGAGFYDAYIVKIDTDGNFVWDNTFGSTSDDYAYSVTTAMDGTYMLSGFTEVSPSRKYDAYVIKVDPGGSRIWERTYGGSQADYGNTVFQEQGRDYLLIGSTYSFTYGGSDIYITKIRGESTDASDNEPDILPNDFVLRQNYPNPFNMSTVIEFQLPERSDVSLEVFNLLGQKVKSWEFESYPAGIHSVTWNGRDEYGREAATGIYLYRITAAHFRDSRKMLLVK